jgi:hypothetical protein
VNDLNRLTLILEQHQAVVVTIGHDRALADRHLFRRISGRLDLHDFLLRERFEIWPAEFAHQEERRGQDRAAVARVALYELAPPLGVEQVGVALRGFVL